MRRPQRESRRCRLSATLVLLCKGGETTSRRVGSFPSTSSHPGLRIVQQRPWPDPIQRLRCARTDESFLSSGRPLPPASQPDPFQRHGAVPDARTIVAPRGRQSSSAGWLQSSGSTVPARHHPYLRSVPLRPPPFLLNSSPYASPRVVADGR